MHGIVSGPIAWAIASPYCIVAYGFHACCEPDKSDARDLRPYATSISAFPGALMPRVSRVFIFLRVIENFAERGGQS